jgi:hypothetical protein
MLIFNVKTDEDNIFVTPLEEAFFYRINRPRTEGNNKAGLRKRK